SDELSPADVVESRPAAVAWPRTFPSAASRGHGRQEKTILREYTGPAFYVWVTALPWAFWFAAAHLSHLSAQSQPVLAPGVAGPATAGSPPRLASCPWTSPQPPGSRRSPTALPRPRRRMAGADSSWQRRLNKGNSDRASLIGKSCGDCGVRVQHPVQPAIFKNLTEAKTRCRETIGTELARSLCAHSTFGADRGCPQP